MASEEPEAILGDLDLDSSDSDSESSDSFTTPIKYEEVHTGSEAQNDFGEPTVPKIEISDIGVDFECSQNDLIDTSRVKIEKEVEEPKSRHKTTTSRKGDFLCKDCINLRFKTKDSLRRHVKSHKPFPCQFEGCSILSYTEKGFFRHRKTHCLKDGPNGERIFACTLQGCSQVYNSDKCLNNHIWYKHSRNPSKKSQKIPPGRIKYPDRPFICKKCGKSFESDYSLKRHIKVTCSKPKSPKRKVKVKVKVEESKGQEEFTGSKRRFLCEACDFRFLTKYDLQRHINTHNPLPCQVEGCSNVSYNTNVFYTHLKTHEIQKSGPNGEIVYSCTFTGCSKIYKTMRFLMNHQNRAKHTQNPKKIVKLDPNPPFICGKCGREYKAMDQLNIHIKNDCSNTTTTTKTYPCTFPGCNRIYKTKSHLKSHLIIHTGSRDYKCEFCEAGFGRKSVLNTHRLMVHFNLLPDCERNEKKFAKIKENYKESKKRSKAKKLLKKDGEEVDGMKRLKSYPCTYQGCDKVYKGKNGLAHHLKVHQGLRDYLCEFCGAGFVKNDILGRHRLRHHLDLLPPEDREANLKKLEKLREIYIKHNKKLSARDKVRDDETEEEREARRARYREKMRKYNEKKKEEKKKEIENKRKILEKKEKKSERKVKKIKITREKLYEWRKKREGRESPEERKKRLDKLNEMWKKNYAKLDPERKAARLERYKRYGKMRRRNMTREEKDIANAKKRAYIASRKNIK